MLKTVVLPAPFGPISPSSAPGCTVRSKLPTARKPPKTLVRPVIWRAGVPGLRRHRQRRSVVIYVSSCPPTSSPGSASAAGAA